MGIGARRYCATVERMETVGDVDTSPDRWRTVAQRYWLSMEAVSDTENEEGKGLSHVVTYLGRGEWRPVAMRPQPQDRLTISGQRYTVREVVDPTGARRELRLRFSQVV